MILNLHTQRSQVCMWQADGSALLERTSYNRFVDYPTQPREECGHQLASVPTELRRTEGALHHGGTIWGAGKELQTKRQKTPGKATIAMVSLALSGAQCHNRRW